MVTKTYQNLISPLFSTTVFVDGERRDVRFVTGGKVQPRRVNGKFRTSDPELIKVLDESPYYGKKWVCINSTEPVKEEQEGEAEETKVPEEEVIKNIEGPTSAKQMREYLNKKLGVPYSKLPNKDAALRVAKEMNLNFVNVN